LSAVAAGKAEKKRIKQGIVEDEGKV